MRVTISPTFRPKAPAFPRSRPDGAGDVDRELEPGERMLAGRFDHFAQVAARAGRDAVAVHDQVLDPVHDQRPRNPVSRPGDSAAADQEPAEPRIHRAPDDLLQRALGVDLGEHVGGAPIPNEGRARPGRRASR